jgi:hypothetical protein
LACTTTTGKRSYSTVSQKGRSKLFNRYHTAWAIVGHPRLARHQALPVSAEQIGASEQYFSWRPWADAAQHLPVEKQKPMG